MVRGRKGSNLHFPPYLYVGPTFMLMSLPSSLVSVGQSCQLFLYFFCFLLFFSQFLSYQADSPDVKEEAIKQWKTHSNKSENPGSYTSSPPTRTPPHPHLFEGQLQIHKWMSLGYMPQAHPPYRNMNNNNLTEFMINNIKNSGDSYQLITYVCMYPPPPSPFSFPPPPPPQKKKIVETYK